MLICDRINFLVTSLYFSNCLYFRPKCIDIRLKLSSDVVIIIVRVCAMELISAAQETVILRIVPLRTEAR